MDGKRATRPPYAPPFLKAGKLVDRADREHPALSRPAPEARAARRGRTGCGRISCSSPSPIWSRKFTTPIIRSRAGSITRSSARRRSATPRISGAIACRNSWAISSACSQNSGGHYLFGRRLSYVDLSLFQIVEGLRYAFPKRMKRFEKKVPRLIALHDRVAERPRIAAYLPRSGAFRSTSGASSAISRSSTADVQLGRAAADADPRNVAAASSSATAASGPAASCALTRDDYQMTANVRVNAWKSGWGR